MGLIDRIAYTLLKTFEVIIFTICVCFSFYLIALFVALLVEIHPAFWLCGIIIFALSAYFFFSYKG